MKIKRVRVPFPVEVFRGFDLRRDWLPEMGCEIAWEHGAVATENGALMRFTAGVNVSTVVLPAGTIVEWDPNDEPRSAALPGKPNPGGAKPRR